MAPSTVAHHQQFSFLESPELVDAVSGAVHLAQNSEQGELETTRGPDSKKV
jgi:hypothetical protein